MIRKSPLTIALLLMTALIQADETSDTATLRNFYEPNQVQSVYLEVAEADIERMLTALPKRIYVPASFRWRDTTIEKVAIRFKGNSSSNPRQRHKRGYLIKFNEYKKGQRFHGLRRASLDNGVQFGSLFSEPILTEILRKEGIPVHRCNYARLYVNDTYKGIYTNVERIDQSFVDRNLPDAGGALYKNDTGGPGGNLQFVSENADTYKKAFEQKNDTATKEMARLVDFIKFVNQAEAKDFQLRLKARLELDDFLRVTAVMLYGGAFDQLTGWNPHNFYLYHNRKQDRWRYLPWDLDVGFCATAFGRIAVLEHWNAAWPVPLSAPPNPLLERIISNPELLARYRQIAREILDKHFKPEPLCAIIDAKYALIKKDLVADPFPHQRATNSQDQNYEGIVASMKDFARQRYSAADRQLANPGERPQPVRRAGPPNMPPKLAEKIHQLQKRAERIQQHMRRIGPLLQRGKMEEAEKLVDEALNL